MAKQISCSICSSKKWLSYQLYLTNLANFQCSSQEELEKCYLCRKCRKLLKPSSLRETPEYQRLQQTLQTEVNEAIRRGINDPLVRQNFLKNIKQILDKRWIRSYTFQVKDNMLVGIVLEQVSFFGNVLVPLKNKRGEYGNR